MEPIIEKPKPIISARNGTSTPVNNLRSSTPTRRKDASPAPRKAIPKNPIKPPLS